ncbi:hypothetical protein [Inquilinus limosus]|uniref:hypothetical protein n=1 Tax=Inquilinus limosus TaxID=171674 RepID=UPI0003FFF6AF|nr:hypothetical protein [Inquilinus limosus]
MQICFRLLPAALALAAGLAAAPPPARAQAESDKLIDFMIMDVCVDQHDRILPGLAPGDADCTRRRNIRAGEAVPYHLHNFGAPGGPCPQRLGTVSKDNIPIEKRGVTRIVSFYDRGVDHSCPDADPDAPSFGKLDAGREGGSVQWVDERWGYIMGSWSPVALSYWLTPSCAGAPDTSGRFRYGWVIGPATLPPEGQGGFEVFQSKLVTAKDGREPEAGCPKRFARPFTMWMRDRFTYKDGRTLDSLISLRFSGSSKDGDGPGRAPQVEITYWTKEFGLTRWEKWARDDWVHPRNRQAAATLGRTLFARDTCSRPYVFRTSPVPGLTIEDSGSKDDYGRVLTDTRTGESHAWHMSLCNDYSNVVKDPDGGLVPPWGQGLSDIFWAE